VTSSSEEGASSNITIYCGRQGVDGGKKRRNQHFLGATTMTDHNDANDGDASGSSTRRT
jgi:hypothetical protein